MDVLAICGAAGGAITAIGGPIAGYFAYRSSAAASKATAELERMKAELSAETELGKAQLIAKTTLHQQGNTHDEMMTPLLIGRITALETARAKDADVCEQKISQVRVELVAEIKTCQEDRIHLREQLGRLKEREEMNSCTIRDESKARQADSQIVHERLGRVEHVANVGPSATPAPTPVTNIVNVGGEPQASEQT